MGSFPKNREIFHGYRMRPRYGCCHIDVKDEAYALQGDTGIKSFLVGKRFGFRTMKRGILFTLAATLLAVLPLLLFDSPIHAGVVSIGSICLLLWITEVVPPFVPTLLLWTLIPLFLSPLDLRFGLPNVLSSAADPVMALFFGGFVIGLATNRSGLGLHLMQYALRSSGTSFRKFLLFVIVITAFLSMWMSNIAAASLVLGSLYPVLRRFENDHIFRRSLLLAVALGADFGGIATPIGTGPNAIAIASLSATQPVSFLSWMAFAFPLTLLMLASTYVFLLFRTSGSEDHLFDVGETLSESQSESVGKSNQIIFTLILIGTIALWLTEPLHKIPSSVVALGSAAALFLSRILGKRDLVDIDWSTLILIAGGITLGSLIEDSGLISTLAATVPFAGLDPRLSLFLLCLSSALFSAVMSNTATAVFLIPLAGGLIPDHSTPILIAISASFGIPFVISTPPNAMVFGQGGLRFSDLFWPGVVLMLGGCVLVSATGPMVLRWAGIH
jgi:sodium-dependent dicarboxylate transporter 2/3/5